MLLGRSSPVSPRGQPGQVLQGPGRSLLGQLLHPGGEQFPSFGHRSGLCQRVLASPQTPFHPGEQRRSRTRSAPSWGPQARPSARKDEAVPRAPLPPPSCAPPPAGPQPCLLTRQRPAACPRQLRLSGGCIHPGRAAPSFLLGLHRGAAGHPDGPAGGKFPQRKEEGRDGAGRGGEAGGRAPGGRGEGAAPAPLQEAAGEAAHRGRPS